jgi:hypothetical protein
MTSPVVRFLLFVLVSVVTRASLLWVTFIDLDESAHILGSWTLLDGHVLYRDFVDNKPPLLYVAYALPQLLFGRGMLVVRWFATLLVLPGTAYAASAFFKHDRQGLVAGCLYLIYGAAFLGHDMLAVNCEVLALLPGAWALVYARPAAPERPLGADVAVGILLGLAALIKPQLAIWVTGVGFAVLLGPESFGRRALRLCMLGAGLGTVLALSWVFFAALGAGDDYVRWMWKHNLGYAANAVSAGAAMQRAAVRLGPWVLVTAWLWWGTWASRADLSQPTRHRWNLLAAVVISTVPAIFVGERFFPHYFIQLYWPLAVAAAPALTRWLSFPLSKKGQFLSAYTALMLVGFSIANLALYLDARSTPYEEIDPIYRQVGSWLRNDICSRKEPGQKTRNPREPSGGETTLFVWGYAPAFYYYSGMEPASRFIIPQASISGYVPGNPASFSGKLDGRAFIRSADRTLLLADLKRNRATYVLDTSPAAIHYWQYFPVAGFPLLETYLRDGFEMVHEIRGVRIFRRRACAQASGLPVALDLGADFP